MSTSTQTILATLEFLAWRDEQMAAISAQLEDAYPALRAALDRMVDEGDLVSVAAATTRLRPAASKVIRTWSEEQGRIALARAAAELEDVLAAHPPDLDAGADGWTAVAATALPAAAGVGLVAASLAAIPTVISFATVTTSSFAFFATSTVSWPLFAVGAAVLAVASFAGSTVVARAVSEARALLKRRLGETAARAVFGTGLAPDARCLLNDLQALIVRAGLNRLQEAP